MTLRSSVVSVGIFYKLVSSIYNEFILFTLFSKIND